MDTKQLIAALKEIEPHATGDVVQGNYLEVRVQDPNDPEITYPLDNVKGRFFCFPDGELRYIISLE